MESSLHNNKILVSNSTQTILPICFNNKQIMIMGFHHMSIVIQLSFITLVIAIPKLVF